MLAEVGEHCRKTPCGSLHRTQRSVVVAWSSWGQDSWKHLMSAHGRSMSRCRFLGPLSCWCWGSRNGWRCSRRRRDAASGIRCWTVSRLTTRSSTPGARIACATTSLAAACGETTWNRGTKIPFRMNIERGGMEEVRMEMQRVNNDFREFLPFAIRKKNCAWN